MYMDLQLRNFIYFSRATPLGEPGKSILTLLSFRYTYICMYLCRYVCLYKYLCALVYIYMTYVMCVYVYVQMFCKQFFVILELIANKILHNIKEFLH